ncbi:MAG: thioesterase family protein [Proteobacteria bacterium]|nr:thioesterase family protein [Pseudomonadota bacterium]MDA1332447.1 thioesterase family protein [Pseudomonadota bacterium]
MKDTLKKGLTYRHTFIVTENQTVPKFYPESDLFQAMPQVFATGYLVGLLEWACIELLRPHIDWPEEQTLGTHVNFSHEAPTLPGMTVTVDVTLVNIEGRKLSFSVKAHDGIDIISKGIHQRAIIQQQKFLERLEQRRKTITKDS